MESNGYEQVNGGLGTFQFGASPPDKKGNLFVVAADVNPWCSSNWQGIRYRTYRLGGDPFSRLLSSRGWQASSNGTTRFRVEADRFHLTFPGSQGLDIGILTRDYIRAFRVTGTRVERIGPLAKEPRGFIDEWISHPGRSPSAGRSIPSGPR